MCGRFTLRTAPTEFGPPLQLDLFSPRYNIAPTSQVLALRVEDAEQRWAWFRWGLIPSWAKDAKFGYRSINARAETVAEKPAFRAAFQRRRCLVVADGYYEWKAVGRRKQPYHIRMRGAQPFAFAGLWERWKGPPDAPLDEPLETCTIITTDANELTAPVHDRMPVILPREAQAQWLDPECTSKPALTSLLVPYGSSEMEISPVNPYVNKVGNEGPACLEPAGDM